MDASTTTVPRARRSTRPISGRPRILVVEDEAHNLEIFERALRREHDVVLVATIGAALEALEASRFDLLLTDQGLRGELGTDLAAIVRARWPGGKIMIITGWGGDPIVRAALTSGLVDRVVAKPFRPHQLRSEVDELLADLRAGRSETALARAGDTE